MLSDNFLCTWSSPVPQPPVLHHEPERGVGHARQALMRERRPGIKLSAEEPRDDFGSLGPDQCATAGQYVAGALCELCVFARRRRHWLAEQRRRRDAASASVTLPVPLVPEEDSAPLTSPRRRQSHEAHTA